ncbi:MAG: T9SS type A sorting domain-containing protein [Flavobacteriales bacterium]|nr:T9SS type A sorting domain-containing protein [Flavobacteriales bacterium]
MKVSKLFLCVALLSFTAKSYATWGPWEAFIVTSLNGGSNTYYEAAYDGTDDGADFNNNYFGRLTSSNTLVIKGGEVKTFKNGSSNVCNTNMHYRVYRTGDTPGSFSNVSIPWSCDFPCGGLFSAGDQKWNTTSGTTDVLSGLTDPGTYVLEVYWDAYGDDSNPSSCPSGYYKNIHNGGINYKAYFEFDTNDCFADGDFSSPTWNGDTGNYSIINNSNTSGLTGSENIRTSTIRLNASGSGTQSISTQISSWQSQQEWYFWLGRNGNGGAPQDFDNSNQQAVYLLSTTSDLESGSCNGYRILIGEAGTSYIKLQRIDSGVATTIFVSSTGIPNGLTDYGITFKVVRSQLGQWTIRTSVLPTNALTTQSTPTPNSAPEDISTITTVNHGSVTDNTYAPATNNYFGFQSIHDSSTEGVQAAEFDNFRLVTAPPDTYLQISGAITGSVDEDVANTGNYAIALSLTNSSASVTTVDLVLTSGSAARAGRGTTINTNYSPSYTTITVTWPASSTATQYVYIDPDDNSACDDIATLVFQLQNPTGGTNVFVGPADTFTLSIVDDNTGYETLLDEDFESGIGSWTTTGTSWATSSVSPIADSYSARHSTQAVSGTSSLVTALDDANLTGISTTWRFEVSFANDATANNNFQYFLTANETDLYSATLDGYAVVIDQSSLPSVSPNDYIRLYRVDNGAYASTPIVNSTTDWITNVSGGSRVGFEVSLDDAGTWTLKVDANGGFDALSTLGTGTDLGGGGITYPSFDYTGIRFKYLPAASDLFRIDEISIAQQGCKEIWYSQGNGNSDGAIWDDVVSGTGAAVVSGRYDRFVIQSGDNVTVNNTWLTRSVAIENGGTLTGGTGNLVIYESFANDGTFTANTSTVTFKGQAAQSILGANSTTFHNITVDNDGSTVTVVTAASATGVVAMEEGTLQTGDILTLVSNSSGSASIGQIKAGASVSGEVTLQRYIPSIPYIYGNWVNIGCPLTGQTIADWDDDILTTGFTGSNYPPPYPFNNIRRYYEQATGTMNTGYVGATNVTNALSDTTGYFVWFQGSAQNIDNTGNIQSGTITHTLGYTVTSPGGIFDYGWNLMSNPYPSEVDWNSVSAGLSGPKVYYVFDYETNAYKYRNATTNTGTASRYIPHSQSFLIKVNTSGQTLSYQESYKTNNGTSFERSEESQTSFLAMQLSRNGMSDEGILIFSDASTFNYDNGDVYDLESPSEDAVEFSLISADDVMLAQDARPFTSDIHIPVRLDLPAAGNYTFSIIEGQNLPFGSCLYIEDLVTGETMNLLPGESMTIHTNEPYQGNRLMIHGSAPVTTVVTEPSCNGGADGSIDITAPAGSWSIALTGDGDDYQYVSGGSITFDHLAAGIYQLEVNNTSGGCGNLSTTFVISEPSVVQSQITDYSIVQCNEGTDGRIEWNVEGTNWFAYDILNAQNQIVQSGEVEGQIGFAENLPAGLYNIHLYTTCSTETLVADLRDPSATQISVNAPLFMLIENGVATVPFEAVSSDNSDLIWNFSNGTTATGNNVLMSFTESGTYGYTVTSAGDCAGSCSGVVNIGLETTTQEQGNISDITVITHPQSVELRFGIVSGGKCNVNIYDMAGHLVASKTSVVNSGQTIILDTTNLSSGIYNIQVITADEQSFVARVYKR